MPVTRVPSVDPKRDAEIARLQSLLAELERIPAHRREDELADVREKDLREMIADLEKTGRV